jgi:hypothetical protein
MSTHQALQLNLNQTPPSHARILHFQEHLMEHTPSATPLPTLTPSEMAVLSKQESNKNLDSGLLSGFLGMATGLPLHEIHAAMTVYEIVKEDALSPSKQDAAKANLTTLAPPQANEFVPSSKALRLHQTAKTTKQQNAPSNNKRHGAIRFG